MMSVIMIILTPEHIKPRFYSFLLVSFVILEFSVVSGACAGCDNNVS